MIDFRSPGSPTDVCCRAGCVGVPCPNASMANATNNCVAACPKGSGTPSDTASYSTCIRGCYSSLFFPASATGAGATETDTAGSTANSKFFCCFYYYYLSLEHGLSGRHEILTSSSSDWFWLGFFWLFGFRIRVHRH
jgi:hypothetical protein